MLKFTQFINEATETFHASERVAQRIISSLMTEVPIGAIRGIQLMNLNVSEITSKLNKLIKEQFLDRYESRVKNVDFEPGNKYIIVLLEVHIKVGGKFYPITVYVSSYDIINGKPISATYHGEKMCAYVAPNNEILTIKVQPTEYTDDQIKIDDETHQSRHNPKNRVPVIVLSDDYLLELAIMSNGDIIPTGKSAAPIERNLVPAIHTAIKEYALVKGRQLLVKIPYLGDEYQKATMLSVDNRKTAKLDGFILVSIELENGTKLKKKLAPGAYIGLPIENGEDFEEYRVDDKFMIEYKDKPDPLTPNKPLRDHIAIKVK